MVTRRWVDEHGQEIEESDRGLVYDLQTLVDRRKVLGLFGGLSAAALLAACGGSGASGPGASGSASGATTTTSSSASGDLDEVPEETPGPYPGDGSNGPNVLDDSGIVRSDIRSSFGSSTTTAAGAPLTIKLTVRDAGAGDAASGAGVYLWHCDRDGNYSLYSEAAANENYLRGAQEADANGTVTSSRSSRPATRGAGRTSTSRSTAVCPTPPRRGRSSRRHRSPAQGGLRGGLRHLRLRAECRQHGAGQPGR